MEAYAPGIHLLVDYWGVRDSQNLTAIERAFRDAVAACGATLLNIQLHAFGEGAGVTGVAILAESHMSIHTWPERDYMAIDIFMCGDSNPHLALKTLQQAFQPQRIKLTECKRGQVE